MASSHADDPDPVSEKKMDPDRKHQKSDFKLFFMIKVFVKNDGLNVSGQLIHNGEISKLPVFTVYKVKLYITPLKYKKNIISSGKRKG